MFQIALDKGSVMYNSRYRRGYESLLRAAKGIRFCGEFSRTMKFIDDFIHMYLVVTVFSIATINAAIFLSVAFSVICCLFAGLLLAFSAVVCSIELSSSNQLFR